MVNSWLGKFFAKFDCLVSDENSLTLSWKSFLCAILCGLGSALALPPLSWLWVLPLVWSVIYRGWVICVERVDQGIHKGLGKRAFSLGWAFGAGYFAAGLYWVCHAFLVEPELYGWLIPLVLLGLGFGLGLFSGLAFFIAFRLARWLGPHPLLNWVCFAAVWMLMECFRGWVLTGFPWNTIGSMWAPYPIMCQGAAFIGMIGLSLVTVLVITAPTAGGCGAFGKRCFGRGIVVSCLTLSVLAGFGFLRIPDAPTKIQPDVMLRVVQPNLSQEDKWNVAKRYDNLVNLIRLSQQDGWSAVTHVIWPETAVTYPLSSDGIKPRKFVSQAVPPNGWLLTGAPRRSPRNEPLRIWNSLFAIDEHGVVGDVYDKSHLVPFGEYVPLGKYLPINKMTSGRVDFTAGLGPRTVSLPRTPPYSPSVCYEIIFPDQVVNPTARPDWIVNVTNDGWFGLSAGPYQHFSAAVFRAIEQGVPVVRAANTGISAVIDPYGQVIAKIKLGQKGILDAPLPQPLTQTAYSLIGLLAPVSLAIFLVFSAYALCVFKKKKCRLSL